jgi:hypothetical protein
MWTYCNIGGNMSTASGWPVDVPADVVGGALQAHLYRVADHVVLLLHLKPEDVVGGGGGVRTRGRNS